MAQLDIAAVERLAERAHAGQTDKVGRPYIEHVRAVAHGVAPFGAGPYMAALLHDAVEDSPLTYGELLALGVPPTVVAAVERVTNRAGVPYLEMVRGAAAEWTSCLVKIADNAHNSLASRSVLLPEERRAALAAKYGAARAILWPAAPAADVATVLERVNPPLAAEFAAWHAVRPDA